MSPKLRSSCRFVKNPRKKYVCVYILLFRQKEILTYMVPKPVVQAKMLASPKFLNVCLRKSVVSVVLSKILARNVYVSRQCSLGENASKAKIFKCMSPKVRSSCRFVKNPCKKYVCVYFVLFCQKSILTYRVPNSVVQAKMLASPNTCQQTHANTCKHLQILINTCKHLQTLANVCKHLQILANICKHLHTLANTCKLLQMLANSCKHLQTLKIFANTCKNLQKLANTCKQLTTLENTCKHLQ